MDGERELIARARRGDSDAFAELMRAHQDRVFSLALRMTGHREDAADVAQEAFVNAWRGLARFQGESSFSTWIYRLTSNAAIDFLRREKRRRGESLTIYDGEEERQNTLPDPAPGPEEQSERRALADAVREGIDCLSDEHREILILRELSELTYAEIGDMLGLEEGTVKSRIARARMALRKILLASGNILEPVASEQGKGR